MDVRMEVLELLAENARLTIEQLATMLDLDEQEARRLVEELEESHTILGYRTLVNWDKVQKERVTALIEVKVTPQRDVGFRAVAERIGRFPEVKSLHLMSGAYDLAVFIEGRTMQEVAFFVATKLAPIDGVMSTTTHFVLQTFKKEGILLEEADGDHRLVMSP
ncbi:MAG: Lrp/AsnC family transcriptional regulator [Eubacteriales bacterium]|nr:Lrp/AsnC family transcriptional regulator [Bacillota bacterium]MBV1727534.1 Lrp/AsnC family transcriptional regulator [Desulforudis sp.]MDQ7790199.1 Lrp/AsnC family transcriptional regulator [Clostridia bacterium]MDZ4043912.1 Lrp/AsnC family transcriptional regulator [Eubacteriales bacterium]MBU4534162.1 Lrp/AsnC family transcriptional regulator [Bacillota bacterium]